MTAEEERYTRQHDARSRCKRLSLAAAFVDLHRGCSEHCVQHDTRDRSAIALADCAADERSGARDRHGTRSDHAGSCDVHTR